MNLNIFQEYDQILLGNRNAYLSNYFYNPKYNEKIALSVFKYALTYYLDWTPEDIYSCLNYDVICMMKLDELYKHIEFPCELDKMEDFYYIAVLLYPKKFKINQTKLAVDIYKKVLSGKLCKFPKEYLVGEVGAIRAYVCFQYMLTNFLQIDNIEELYSTFSKSSGGKILQKYKLMSMCSELFEHPLDLVHESLPSDKRSEFLYNFYKYKVAEKKYRSEITNIQKC